MITSAFILFLVCIFFVAFLFSACGQGGASGFLALMSLYSIEPTLMKSAALLLNIFVTVISFYQYYKSGYFKIRLFIPLIILSVPMAFIGASLTIDESVYRRILGVCLLLTAISFFASFNKSGNDKVKAMPIIGGILTGASIGFLSGLVGIGGGVLLSPVMLWFKWARFKEVSAITSLFILINSIAGVGGILNAGNKIPSTVFVWILIAVIAAFAGSYWGSKKAPESLLKTVLGCVLFIAAIKLILL